jgi:microtubule-associated protein-like 1/2
MYVMLISVILTGPVRVIAEGRGSQLLVGTTRNCILIGSLDLGLTPVVCGHTDELWGLAIHPSLPQFLTAGHDHLVTLWDSMSHSMVWSKDVVVCLQSKLSLEVDCPSFFSNTLSVQ